MLPFDSALDYAALRTAYAEADAMAAWPEARLFRVAEEVSAWSPAQHLYHITRVNSLGFRTLARLGRGGGMEGGGVEGGAPNRAGAFVLGTGGMPRGRGVAPDITRPPDDLDRAALTAALARSREGFEALAPTIPVLDTFAGRITHPALGDLNAVEWLRAMHIHTNHHLAIIRDIDAAEAG